MHVNSHFQLQALERLLPAGFRKQREFFFLIREPNILVLYRKFDSDRKESFYLAFTHTFFTKVVCKSGAYLIPPLLEHYPVSITTSELRSQFRKHQFIEDFDCDLHHLPRELFPAYPQAGKPSFGLWNTLKKLWRKGKVAVPDDNPVDIVLQEGMAFFQQFSPGFSYQVLQKNRSLNSPVIDEQLAECVQYIQTHTP